MTFRTVDQYETPIHNWTWTGQASTPTSDKLNFRINLWLLAPPSNGQEAEVIVSGFSFENGPFEFVPITPCRVVDTRDANGPLGGALYLPLVEAENSSYLPASATYRRNQSRIL